LAESLRRLGELDQAADTIRPLLLSAPEDASLRALASRILIDQGNLAQAIRQLDAWTSGNQTSNLDIDLVRLQLAIREAQSQAQPTAQAQKSVGDWIQRIGTRHGDFARRRAERLVLGTSLASGSNKLDPRIIIAQAATRLREGNATQAAEMLESASRSATDPAASLQLAIAGAAAFQKAEEIANAARLLRETSLTHYEQPDAPKLHLQSALLQSQTAAPEALIEHLQEGVMTWPGDPSSMTAIDWLIRIHDARGELLEKAEAATLGHPSWMTRERLEQATTHWADAIVAAPFADRDTLARTAIDAFEKYEAAAGANESIAFLATLFRNRDGLSGIDVNASGPEWIRWLLLIRKGGAVKEMPDLTGVTDRLRVAAADRLIADGNDSVQEQKAIGRAVLSLVGAAASIQAAQAHGWMGDWRKAESMLDELRRQAPDDFSIAQQSASLLARAPDERARRAGLKLWMSLSSQLKQGSDPWHQAKLATITTMKSWGETEEAKRLADFILLTQPDLAPQWVKQYRDASR
jgi:tetratricopeptide (TPR) repeat protein